MKNLRKEQAYVERAAKLQATGDAVKSTAFTLVKIVGVLVILAIIAVGCIVAKGAYDDSQHFAKELSRTFENKELKESLKINTKEMTATFYHDGVKTSTLKLTQNKDNEREFKTEPGSYGVVWYLYVNNSAFLSVHEYSKQKLLNQLHIDNAAIYNKLSADEKVKWDSEAWEFIKNTVYTPNTESEDF